MSKLKFNFGIVVVLLMFASCSVIKNPTSSKFNRVKYRSHVNLHSKENKTQLPKTVESFAKKQELKKMQGNALDLTSLEAQIDRNPKSGKLQITPTKKNLKNDIELQEILQDAKILEKELRLKTNESLVSDWWEDSPEDWPWGQIVLALIAILVIAILIVLLIDILGAIISSLLGLILLIALAYFLYEYWL